MTKPVVIVGAGPAGLACAARLAQNGLQVVMIDDNLQAGGQYFRQLPPSYRAEPDAKLLRETKRVGTLFPVLRDPLVTYLPSTTAWNVHDPLTIDYAGPKGAGRIAAAAMVVATGAQDAPFPFPGWTLPGVISAGGCLNLAKGHGMTPSGKVVVAGNGPLVLVAAATLAAAGAEVTHVIEAQPTWRVGAAMMRGALLSPSLLLKGAGYRARLLAHGTHFLSGKMVSRAIGNGSLNAIEIASVGSDGKPLEKAAAWLKAETLVSGYGLLPGTEFVRMIGCRMVRDPLMGGWVPERSDKFETSVSNVYAIGDGAGIGGVEVAIAEGNLAAGAIIDGGASDGAAKRRYARLNRFRRILSGAYLTKSKLSSATDETIICRCEELRLSDLKSAVIADDKHLHRVKSSTRLGMGRCQGRNCLSSASKLLGLDHEDAALPLPRMRPPVRPLRLNDIIKNQSIGPARVPDEANASKQER